MNNIITFLLEYEKELIVSYILDEYKLSVNEHVYNEDTIHLINENLHLTDNTNLAFKAHRDLIGSLINFYVSNRFDLELKDEYFFLPKKEKIREEIVNHLKLKDIPHIVEELHIGFLNSQFSYSQNQLKRNKSKHYLKEYGAVYTLKKITNETYLKVGITNCKNGLYGRLKDHYSGTTVNEVLNKKRELTLDDGTVLHRHMYFDKTLGNKFGFDFSIPYQRKQFFKFKV